MLSVVTVKGSELKRISVPSLYKRDDRLRLNRVEEGYSCLKTGPWQCSAYTSINQGRSALKDDCERFSHGPVRELIQKFKTCNEMSKLMTIDETMTERCSVSWGMEFN